VDKEKTMAKTVKTRNDVKDNAKKVSIGILQGVLHDGVDLYNSTRQAHWNVKGPHFYSLHTLLEGFYEDLQTSTDDLAERIVQLGGIAQGTTQEIAGGTRLPPYPTELLPGMDHVTQLADRYAAVAKTLRDGIDQTDEAGDADTADLLTEQSRAIDKKLWMLEAFLQADR
jgi:starvation-inducible DNA-binding protein